MVNNEKEMQLNVKTKVCYRCKNLKPHSCFYQDNTTKDKLKVSCKECISKYSKLYNILNKDKIQIKNKEWKTKNAEYAKKCTSLYFENNKNYLYKKSTEYHNNRYNIDPIFKLKKLLRNRINKAIFNKNITFKTTELIGCSLIQFKLYLESQFKPEMTWENYGNIWEIDHKIPCALFDLTDIEQQKQCFHYTNTQPLFKTTEIAKSFGYINEMGNRNKSNKYE